MVCGELMAAYAELRSLLFHTHTRARVHVEKPQTLLGENISILVPPPFDKIHNDFLSRFLNVGEGQIISKLRKLFAIRSDGYLIPV